MEDAFLQAIRESPNDEVPRLIFADWLEEQGDGDRAEFIRLQCEIARLKQAGGSSPGKALEEARQQVNVLWKRNDPAQWCGLVPREGETEPLLKRVDDPEWDSFHWEVRCWNPAATRKIYWSHHWMHELLNWSEDQESTGNLELGADRLLFQRGLPHELRVEAEEFLALGELITRLPSLVHLSLNLAGTDIEFLASSPLLRLFNELDLWDSDLREGWAQQLFLSWDLNYLKLLDLSHHHLTSDDLEVLAKSSRLENLQTLLLRNNRFDDDGLRALADSSRLPKLKVLNLSDNLLDDEAAYILAESTAFPLLERLDLTDNSLTTAGKEMLSHSSAFPRIQELIF